MIEAIKIHGPFVGLALGLRRLSKCHPWGTHGYDPVPEKGALKFKINRLNLSKKSNK
jgi:putative component of membrane protein insertase Oxa1/YidC/SpoIIIJ protein YidD